MARKKKTTARPEARVAAVPAGSELVTGVESPILNLKALNARLLLEIKELRSELAASGAELRRTNEQLEAEQAAASEALEKLVLKVEEANLKTAEAAGLKCLLEESIKAKNDVLMNCNKMKIEFSNLAVENEHLKHEIEAKEAMIKELGQKMDLIKSQANRRGAWAWLIPITSVIIAAGALVYATR